MRGAHRPESNCHHQFQGRDGKGATCQWRGSEARPKHTVQGHGQDWQASGGHRHEQASFPGNAGRTGGGGNGFESLGGRASCLHQVTRGRSRVACWGPAPCVPFPLCEPPSAGGVGSAASECAQRYHQGSSLATRLIIVKPLVGRSGSPPKPHRGRSPRCMDRYEPCKSL